MEKKIRVVILTISILLMLCIWPFCLVRKVADISSNMTSEYGYTEQFIGADSPYTQVFIAQTARIDYIKFKLEYVDDVLSTPGVLHFKLLDKKGNVIQEQDIAFADKDKYFWHVDIKEWVQKGEEYQFSISVDEAYNHIFKGVYTVRPEDDAPGSLRLYLGEDLVEGGQALALYGYGFPLNYKNILCLWAFILAMGLGLCACCRKVQDKQSQGKISLLWEKVWNWAHKYQILILLAEMLGIVLLTTYICGNKAVDWDEAYSFTMVTKLSLVEMVHTTALDMHPPLYYLLLRLFGIIFGTEFFALKMMSVVMNGCVMVLGVTLIRRNWGAKAAFLFNLVIGLGAQFIFYAVNIRMYALALFFVMWSALLAYEIVQKKGRLRWVLFVLSSLGGVLTHYFAVVPLTLIYGYLLIGLFLERRKDCKCFFWCCVATVLGYLPWLVIWIVDTKKGIDALIGHLPWLSVVLHTFQRKETGSGIDLAKVNYPQLFEWMFSTNIKFSVVMGITLLVIGVIMFLLRAKSYSRKKRLFLEMCATNLLLSYGVIALLASSNAHFFDNRYVFAALGTFWLFVAIIFSEKGRLVSCLLAASLTIWGLSAYKIQMAVELGTNPYMGDTYNMLEQVRGEKVILYNFPTYHILYGAHLPNQEFVELDDIDWENLEQDYIYFISWGGKEIPWSLQQHYQMQIINCGTLRFEEGMADIKLLKVCLQR